MNMIISFNDILNDMNSNDNNMRAPRDPEQPRELGSSFLINSLLSN